MTVTTAMPWPARLVLAAALLGLGALGGIWASDWGREMAGMPARPSGEQLQASIQQMQALQQEMEKLLTQANTAESQLAMERAAQKQLALQFKTLEAENNQLKEDLAFFERMLPLEGKASSGVAIRGISAELRSPNQLDYRLLVMQRGKGVNNFEGTLRLTVAVQQNGRVVEFKFPDAKSPDINNFRLGFRHYQRLEGTLTLPAGATARTLQATVLEKGQVRAQQSLNL
jgi:hypothetical protein